MKKRTSINTLYSLSLIVVFSIVTLSARAQKVAISTNAVNWAYLATVNLEAGVRVHQHFSIQAGARYNPWNFKTQKLSLPLYNHQTTAYAGFRYWPRYVFSGWWFGAQAQLTDYEETGVWRHALDIGKAIGGGMSFGYTLMLYENLNIEFGAGIWAGRRYEHVLYCCPDCMLVRESGPGNFVALNDISISLMYVF